SEVERTGSVASSEVPAEAWAVLLAQDEVRRLIEEPPSGDPATSAATRLRAVLGRPADPRPLSRADLDAARAALPDAAFAAGTSKGEELLKLYERWSPDAAWSGFSFRAVPLSALP